MITAVDRTFLDVSSRVAQLSSFGVRRLHTQLVGFFTGLDAEEVLLEAAAKIAQELQAKLPK